MDDDDSIFLSSDDVYICFKTYDLEDGCLFLSALLSSNPNGRRRHVKLLKIRPNGSRSKRKPMIRGSGAIRNAYLASAAFVGTA